MGYQQIAQSRGGRETMTTPSLFWLGQKKAYLFFISFFTNKDEQSFVRFRFSGGISTNFCFDCTIYILLTKREGSTGRTVGPRSWQYGPSAAGSVQERPRGDILPVLSWANLVNKGFITRLETALKRICILKIGTRKISWKQCAAKKLKKKNSKSAIHSGVLQWFLGKISFVPFVPFVSFVFGGI